MNGCDTVNRFYLQYYTSFDQKVYSVTAFEMNILVNNRDSDLASIGNSP